MNEQKDPHHRRCSRRGDGGGARPPDQRNGGDHHGRTRALRLVCQLRPAVLRVAGHPETLELLLQTPEGFDSRYGVKVLVGTEALEIDRAGGGSG